MIAAAVTLAGTRMRAGGLLEEFGGLEAGSPGFSLVAPSACSVAGCPASVEVAAGGWTCVSADCGSFVMAGTKSTEKRPARLYRVETWEANSRKNASGFESTRRRRSSLR